MEHVNYEERYPTVVTEENTPSYPPLARPNVHELSAPSTPAPTYRSYSQPDHNESTKPANTPEYSHYSAEKKNKFQEHIYPEVAQPGLPTPNYYSNAIPPKEEKHEAPLPLPPRRYCGLTKKLFLIVCIVVGVVIIAAVGGGIGGAVASKNSKKTVTSTTDSSANNGTAQTGSATSSSTGSLKTSPTSSATSSSTSSALAPLDTSASIGSIAASTVQGVGTKVYIHMYYQQGSNIAYRTYPGSGSFTAAQALPLSVAPKAGSPIAATEFSDTKLNYMQVFYLDSNNNIMMANLTSPINNSTLTLYRSVQIAAGTTVFESSSLVAVWLGTVAQSWRVYYQGLDGKLLELVGLQSSWKAGASLVANAVPGSALSISMVPAPNMNIFYVDSSTENLYQISYSSGGWSTPSAVASSINTWPTWNGTSTSLAAIQETAPNYLRTYYIGSNSQVYEFFGNPGAFPTVANSDQSPVWGDSDSLGPGALAGVGWSDQVRLYYLSGGKLVQVALNNATWTSSTF